MVVILNGTMSEAWFGGGLCLTLLPYHTELSNSTTMGYRMGVNQTPGSSRGSSVNRR